MMKKISVLVLTDFRGHSDQNSIYPLVRELSTRKEISHVDVSSRSFSECSEFFENKNLDALYGKTIDQSFDFDATELKHRNNLKKLDYTAYDLIWIRLARPISDEFLLWLEKEATGTIFNRPSGIIRTSSKAFLTEVASVCPPIKLVHSVEEILAFAQKMDIVLKPLKEYGGKGILKINGDKLDDGKEIYPTKDYLNSISEYIQNEGYLAMKFLKNVSEGDKRILVVNGEILASSLRLPQKDSWLCNVAQGGTSVHSEVTEEEIKIIETISPILLSKGILIFGADTLMDDDGKRILSEVNTLSIGGFPQAEAQTGRPIIKQTINKIIEYANTRI